MKKDLLVYIGRFQPFHCGHKSVILKALSLAERVIILVGSSFQPRTPKNPWSFDERKDMIINSIEPEFRDRIIIEPLRDRRYNDELWLTEVQKAIYKNKQDAKTIGIIGHNKDDSSYYLKKFPQWDQIEVPIEIDIDATTIRLAYFKNESLENVIDYIPDYVMEYMDNFKKTIAYGYVFDEQKFLDDHAAMWSFAKYPPTFNTADAVVIQSGHILLIRRRNTPGKGLWALPGGYLSGDTFLDAAIRELQEETSIKLQEVVLRRSVREAKVFDHPKRSLRGRIITVAHLIYLDKPSDGLPKVKGTDDADDARWFPISQFQNMENVLFEDHYAIGMYFIGQL